MDDGLPTLTLYPEHAELFRLGIRTIETRGWATRYRGRLGLHAGKRDPDSAAAQRDPLTRAAFAAIPHGDPLTRGALVATAELVDVVPIEDLDAPADEVPTLDAPAVVYVRPREDPEQFALYVRRHQVPTVDIDISDQLPYGDFTPGRFAWLLEDIKPTTRRCPACWGAGTPPGPPRPENTMPGTAALVAALLPRYAPCAVCAGARHCDPIPVRGRQRLWTWQPKEHAA